MIIDDVRAEAQHRLTMGTSAVEPMEVNVQRKYLTKWALGDTNQNLSQ